ncbi:hypothetical protein D3C75_975830 [compost metagenome]
MAGQHTQQLAGRTAGEAFGNTAYTDNRRIGGIGVEHPADVQRIIQLSVIIEAQHNLPVDQSERLIAGEPDAGFGFAVIMQLSTWHLRQHFTEILQHPILNLTIINNQQLDRDFLQLSLPADGFNA